MSGYQKKQEQGLGSALSCGVSGAWTHQLSSFSWVTSLFQFCCWNWWKLIFVTELWNVSSFHLAPPLMGSANERMRVCLSCAQLRTCPARWDQLATSFSGTAVLSTAINSEWFSRTPQPANLRPLPQDVSLNLPLLWVYLFPYMKCREISKLIVREGSVAGEEGELWFNSAMGPGTAHIDLCFLNHRQGSALAQAFYNWKEKPAELNLLPLAVTNSTQLCEVEGTLRVMQVPSPCGNSQSN